MTATPRLDTPPPLHWDGSRLQVLDQTRLPAEEVVITLSGAADTADAIRRLVVRGAPLIGVAAAYGVAMEVARTPTVEALERGAALLAGARPTARNLGWAVERVAAAALASPTISPALRSRPPRRSGARTRPPAPRSPATAPTSSRPRSRPARSP
jgi:methylthioribose-1-phosphate isomerase